MSNKIRNMSEQQNARKTIPSLSRDITVRVPVPQTKGSGDTTNQKHRDKSKSKNKIPKSVRYDLENALVGLCDVWFEEIKPYLVRNNVKVHVHGAPGADDAGGDRGYFPSGAPACSHLDPASSASECMLCQLLFNAANSIESAVSQAACASVKLASPENFPFNTEPAERKPRLQRRRKRSKASSPLAPSALIPRLCRTYSIIADIPREKNTTRNQLTEKGSRSKKCVTNNKRDNSHPLKPQMKDKSSQTKKTSIEELKSDPKTVPCTKNCGRRRVTKFDLPEQRKASLNKKFAEKSPLFRNDLIDIIAEKNEKRLQVLYSNPNNEACSSIMNLMPSPKCTRKVTFQNIPWK